MSMCRDPYVTHAFPQSIRISCVNLCACLSPFYPSALENEDTDIGLCGWVLVAFSLIFMVATLPLSIWMCIKVSHCVNTKWLSLTPLAGRLTTQCFFSPRIRLYIHGKSNQSTVGLALRPFMRFVSLHSDREGV